MHALPYRFTGYRPLDSGSYVSRIARPHGWIIGTVRHDSVNAPQLSFESPAIAEEFITWARSLRAPDGHDLTSNEVAAGRALQVLRAAAHMNRYAGICYVLDGDAPPWDTGTVRRLPTTVLRQTARHLLQVRYGRRYPKVWDKQAQVFRAVEPPRAKPPLLAPLPTTATASWERPEQLNLFTA